MNDEIRQIRPDDREILEEWVRAVEDMVLGVDVTRGDDDEWPFQVGICAMEFLRKDPLLSEFRGAMRAALLAVPGVTGAEVEDWEVWIVDGTPTVEALTRAAADVVDTFADRLCAYEEALG